MIVALQCWATCRLQDVTFEFTDYKPFKVQHEAAQYLEQTARGCKDVYLCRSQEVPYWVNEMQNKGYTTLAPGARCGFLIRADHWLEGKHSGFWCPICMEKWDGAGITYNTRKLPWTKCLLLGHPTEAVAVSSTKMLDPGDMMIVPISDPSKQERHVVDVFKAISHKVGEEMAREGGQTFEKFHDVAGRRDPEMLRRLRCIINDGETHNQTVNNNFGYKDVFLNFKTEEFLTQINSRRNDRLKIYPIRRREGEEPEGISIAHLPRKVNPDTGEEQYYCRAYQPAWPKLPALQFFNHETKLWEIRSKEEALLLADQCGRIDYHMMLETWCLCRHWMMSAYAARSGHEEVQKILLQPQRLEVDPFLAKWSPADTWTGFSREELTAYENMRKEKSSAEPSQKG